MIVSLLIVTYLLWQVAVPTSYYLGDDVSDERFSWRMFSAVALFHLTCTASVMEIESVSVPGGGDTPPVRRLDLKATLHQAWITLLNRNRRPVVDKFLRTRCQNDPCVTEVQYHRSCPEAGESRMPSVTLRFACATGALAGPPGRP